MAKTTKKLHRKTNETIVVAPDRLKLLFLVFSSFVCAACSIWIGYLLLSGEEVTFPILSLLKLVSPGLYVILAYVVDFLALVFSMFILKYSLARSFGKMAAVVVNSKGIYDTASSIGVGFLRWDEIKDIVVYSYLGQNYLGIVPIDFGKVLSRQRIFKRWILQLNNEIFRMKAPINIPEVFLSMPAEALLERINEHRPRRKNYS